MHEVSREGITHIVRNLRERDRREIFALRWNDDEEALINEICHVAGAMWKVWSWDHEPVAVNGVVPIRPGVVTACACGTDKWKYTLRAMTHWSRTWVIPALRASHYHRGEAHVLAANTDSRRWIESLGGQVECLLKNYGKDREDYLLYAWDLTANEDQKHVYGRWRGQQRSSIQPCSIH
jgi:hypothetical protein